MIKSLKRIRNWVRSRRLLVQIVEGDITTEQVDAIVNAAKPTLMGGGGVDGAIHRAAGRTVLDQCRKLRASTYPNGLPMGQAVATTAGDLPIGWIIHTVGPVFSSVDNRADILRSCYTQSLAVADQLGARSVSFPLISSGVYGWPLYDAVMQALVAIISSSTSVRTVRLVVHGEEAFRVAAQAAEALGKAIHLDRS